MWRTTQDGITAMVTAAGGASVGDRREDALDALNAYIGTGITFKVIQTIGGSDVVRHARTHAGSMSRSGEELALPSTSWTVGTNSAFDPANGSLRVVVHNTSDPTKYIEHDIGPGTTGTISDSFAGTDTLALNCKITATNIEDPGSVATPPAEFSYRIYDNIDAPVTVQPSLVGMHFTDPDNIGGGDIEPDWYALIDATNPASMYHNDNLTGQPVVDGNRVGAVLDTTSNGNHWREWDGDASRPEYKSADGGYIEITDNYTRGMAIDGTNRLVDVRKPFWVAMAIKLGGPINSHAVLMDKDYSENAPLGDQLAAALVAEGLFCQKLIDDVAIGPTVNADAITTSTWGVVSFGYDGTNLTARVNFETKGVVADTRPLPDEDGYMVLRLGGNTPSIVHYKAVGFLDYYPGSAEEVAAIEAVANIAGLTL